MTPLTTEQQELASQWVPFACQQAGKYASKFDGLDVEELTSAALTCVVEAASRFRPGHIGARTGRPAQSLGTMLHLMLRQHLHREACRQMTGGFSRLLSNLTNRHMTFADVPRPASIDAPMGGGQFYADTLEGRPEADEVWGDEIAKLRAELATMPQPMRGVVLARMNGWKLSEIAWHLGLSKERVRQIEMVGHTRLREAFGVPPPKVAKAAEGGESVRCGPCGEKYTPTSQQQAFRARGGTTYCSNECRLVARGKRKARRAHA